MENVADALKMAGAALLFVLAFSITIMLFTKARQTTDAVVDNLKLTDFMQTVEGLDKNETREVGIETIIPTLYRYGQSDDNFRIRILDENGSELQVFDAGIESLVHNGLKTNNTTDQETQKYYAYLNKCYNTQGKTAYMFGAPWVNQSENLYKLERINAYIYGTKCTHMPGVDYTTNRGVLIKYKESKFTESYLEYRTSGRVYTDDYGEEIVLQHPETKVIITYKLIK